MMRARLLLLGGPLAGLLLAGAIAAAEWRSSAFPHRKHERLFPVCEGCHAGIVSGAADDVYPAAADCARCHDGSRVKRVTWEPRGHRASNVRFSHERHRDAVSRAGEATTCQTCHATGAGASRMDIAGPQPAMCVQCHAHSAPEHLAPEARCSGCHVPLTEAQALDTQDIAGFPRPRSHEAPDFLERHGADARAPAASCLVCHARESCERCHANADRVPAVTALGRDARVALLVAGKAPRYTAPASHRPADWATMHGATAARDASRCANCHTRPSCESCHLRAKSDARRTIASLPAARDGAAPGVSPAGLSSRVHPADVKLSHGRWAAAGRMQCLQCHTEAQCASCHAAQDSRAFHPPNFSERHATDAFAGTGECQSCHRSETFCRDCHTRSGVAAQRRMTAAFHTAQPMWVLTHGQAARLGLETCVACHAQNDCIRCHSATGGWGVNPHGSGFAAGRLGARNAEACRLCHVANPAGAGRR